MKSLSIRAIKYVITSIIIITLLVVSLICPSTIPVFAAYTTSSSLNLYASYAALLDGDSNRLLYGKNADVQVPMASTTKIMTCIIALEYAPTDLVCTTSAYAASMPKVKLYAKEGEIFTLKDLLYSLMLKSHNDTAVIIAENIARFYLSSKDTGSKTADTADHTDYTSKELVAVFAGLMNEKARELGCTSTYYITPNGLDASDDAGIHSTTAYELGVIMSYCIKNEVFLEITQAQNHTFSSDKRSYSVTNANTFLNMYPGIISGKTGFTGDAGYCYVCAYRDDDRTLISVVLACGWPYNKSYKWSDTKNLFDYGRNNFAYRIVLKKDETIDTFTVKRGYETVVIEPHLDLTGDIRYLLSDTDKVNVVYSIDSPLERVVGSVCIYINDVLAGTFPICQDTAVTEVDFMYYLRYTLSRLFNY